MYWPLPPMLKSPQRNAQATATPVSIRGVTISSVCCRFRAASVRWGPSTHGKNQLRPVPLKIASYVLSGFFPVVAKTTRPPTKNAKSAVKIGTMTPPARWEKASRSAKLGTTSGSDPGGGVAPADVVISGSPGSAKRLLGRSCGLFSDGSARHRDPQLLLAHVGAVLGDDAALVDHEDAVGEGEDLVELQREEQDGLAAVAGFDQLPVDELDRADVEA